MKTVTDQTFDEERALYGIRDTAVSRCTFEGPADGESALKETARITVDHCRFALRYPLWHVTDFALTDSVMEETARAALWYAHGGRIADCTLGGIKCLRESSDITLQRVTVSSPEYGWRCHGLRLEDCTLSGEYCLMECEDLTLSNVRLTGKYSFQYTKNAVIENAVLDTKDAFWHSRNVTVRNSVISGEYLGWYSDHLTLDHCRIRGTQPLCYCTGLVLDHCTMEDTDLAFEYSDVQATVDGTVLSVKNPLSGRIVADGYGAIITEGSVKDTACRIEVR